MSFSPLAILSPPAPPTPLAPWSWPWSPEGPRSQRLTPDTTSTTSKCFAQPVNPPNASLAFLQLPGCPLCPSVPTRYRGCYYRHHTPIDSGAQNNLPPVGHTLRRMFPGRGGDQSVPTLVLSSPPHLLCPQSWGLWRSLWNTRAG